MELRFGLVGGTGAHPEGSRRRASASPSRYISRLEKRIIRDLRKQLEET